MKRLNKCRTLAKFDEKVLAMVTGQTSTTTTDTESIYYFYNLTQEKSDANKQSGTSSDNKTESNTQQQAQSYYLFFDADEFLITVTKTETGWWYGYKDIPNPENKEVKAGYFPSNYVQVVEEFKDEGIKICLCFIKDPKASAPEEENKEEKDEEFGGHKVDWASYAHTSFMNETQLIVENRLKNMQDPTAAENRNPDGVMRYKKIKRHESRSHAVNPWKGGKVTISQIAVKDQTAVGKAYRQMHHYFDYDQWIDQRNSNPPPKAKADPSRKKAKKMPEWLKKLGEDRDDDY